MGTFKLIFVIILVAVCFWGLWFQYQGEQEQEAKWARCHNTTKTFQNIEKDENGEVINVTDQQVLGQECDGEFTPFPNQ